ncbi:MAG: hypothetical protein LLG37_05285 [Spirochaetia bacterium]|nr:hypothetical protein [Spirochaetia bacterium]
MNLQFAARTLFVTACAVVVLFFAKLWIVDPITVRPADRAVYQAQPQHGSDIQYSKEKVKIDWHDAAKYVDRYVETEGVIVASYRNDKVCYLNFDKNYRDNLSLVVFATRFNRFPDNLEKFYLNKKVRVEGRIKEYKGRLEIILGGVESIKIIDN